MIKPINRHVLIEPLKHESFISQTNDTFEEIGVVVDIAADLTTIGPFDYSIGGGSTNPMYRSVGPSIKVGDKVYFDAWLAVKYPKGEDGFFWLVPYDDIRAIENNYDEKQNPLPI